MAQWVVKYQGPRDKAMQTAYVNSDLNSAREVQTAIEKGEVPDLFIGAGAIVSVQRYDGMMA